MDTFEKATKFLEVENPYEKIKGLVIHELTDGMRTSTNLEGSDAYFDGGIFALRLIHILKTLGSPYCYINVIESKHKQRVNYISIFKALKRLYPVFEDYAMNYNIKLKFVGDLDSKLEPKGFSGNFAKELKDLENKTSRNTGFTSYFFINYSLNWAMKNDEFFKDMPDANIIIRHTKLQWPIGMLLPPSKSDYASIVYIQQGSSSKRWSDGQLICLTAISLRSFVTNYGTQYSKKYGIGENDLIRQTREDTLYLKREELLNISGQPPFGIITGFPPNTKRAIIASPFGPEIYEF